MPKPIKKLKLYNAGFTLIELIIVISIMVILTSAVIANFAGLSQTRNVVSARDTLLSNIRRAQTNALSSKDAATGIPASSYGVVFDLSSPSSYVVFVEDNANPVNRTTIETVRLSSVVISRLEVTNSGGQIVAPNTLTAYFSVPYARSLLSYSTVTKAKDSTATITLRSADGSASKNIVINGVSGNVSTQ